MSDGQFVLYRMSDDAGWLLYVGRTVNLENRLGAHRNMKPWWPRVQTIQLEHFATYEALVEAETAAIEAEAPLYNLDKVPKGQRETGAIARDKRKDGHTIRVPEPGVWDAFAINTKTMGTTPTQAINQFMAWWLGEPTAAEPRRPPDEMTVRAEEALAGVSDWRDRRLPQRPGKD